MKWFCTLLTKDFLSWPTGDANWEELKPYHVAISRNHMVKINECFSPRRKSRQPIGLQQQQQLLENKESLSNWWIQWNEFLASKIMYFPRVNLHVHWVFQQNLKRRGRVRERREGLRWEEGQENQRRHKTSDLGEGPWKGSREKRSACDQRRRKPEESWAWR